MNWFRMRLNKFNTLIFLIWNYDFGNIQSLNFSKFSHFGFPKFSEFSKFWKFLEFQDLRGFKVSGISRILGNFKNFRNLKILQRSREIKEFLKLYKFQNFWECGKVEGFKKIGDIYEIFWILVIRNLKCFNIQIIKIFNMSKYSKLSGFYNF